MIVSKYPVGGKYTAIIRCRQGIVQGSCTVLTLFLFWAGEHSSSLANLQRRLLWYCGMDGQQHCHCHPYCYLICGNIGDEKGVLKVNRAEERGGTKFSLEPHVGTKSHRIWYCFLKLKPKPKKPGKDDGSDWFF
jgi:hypothetical protein